MKRNINNLYEAINDQINLENEVSKMSLFDKLKARKEAKFGDWKIHAVTNDNNDLDGEINYHTHGLEKYGLKNLCIIQPGIEYMKSCQKILNEIAWYMIQGMVFTPNRIHCIDDGKDELFHVFKIIEDVNYDEDVLRIEYLFFTQYVSPTNKKTYIFNHAAKNGGEWIKMEDLMWNLFGNEPRNGREIIHIDGNLSNNAITNLKLK